MTFSIATDGERTASSQFNCYAVLVTGPGIKSLDPIRDGFTQGETVPRNNHCTYPGVGSSFVEGGQDREINVLVPRGRRKFQVVGLQYDAQEQCPTEDAAQFFDRVRRVKAYAARWKGLYQLGHVVAEVKEDTTVTVTDTYSGSGNNLRTCDGKTAFTGDELSLNLSEFTTSVGGITEAITYTGGVGTITAEAEGLGASYTVATNKYVAPSVSGTRKLRVWDSKLNWAEATVTVFDPTTDLSVATADPFVWLTADTHTGANGAAADPTWTNRGSASMTLDGSGSPTVVTDAINGHPSLMLGGGAKYVKASGVAAGSVTNLHAFLVANVSNSTEALCLSSSTACSAADYFSIRHGTGPSGLRTALGQLPSTNTATVPIAYPSAWKIIEARWDTASFPSGSIEIDGTTSSVGAPISTALTFTSGSLHVGEFDGELAEVLLFNSAVSEAAGDDDRLRILEYLEAKYNL